MAKRRLGLWLIGAQGGVGTTVCVGWSALRKKLREPTGVTTELPIFRGLDFADWDEITIGGHEVRKSALTTEARLMHRANRVFESAMLDAVEDDLTQIDQRIRPGLTQGVGATIERLATPNFATPDASPAQAIQRIQDDLTEFSQANKLDRVVVINLASTEPARDLPLPQRWSELEKELAKPDCPITASSLYAIAAMQCGHAYVNFTPSIASELPAIQELAKLRQVCHMGRDGKTGETLLKSVLAPMFAARHLKVMSWVGHNIFGNMDGQVLDDPANKKSKVISKDHLLKQILDYEPQTLVTIEYIRSLGDWKTAWDHIHFSGFLATPMVLQFTWQGCDSILAAPLVLDLFRFSELALRFHVVGLMPWLACYFKSPSGVTEHSFQAQLQMLDQWAQQLQSQVGTGRRT